MYLGFDCAAPVDAKTAKALYAAGYRFAGRYFSLSEYKSKCLTADEAQILSDAGLRILAVFQVGTKDYEGGASAGASYGAAAKASAEDVGMPEDGVIYFAIDSAPTNYDLVATYLRAAASAIEPYRLGVYGSYYVVEQMRERNVGDAYWQCSAWSNWRISQHMNVYQHYGNATECGHSIDRNICPDMDAAGLWKPDKPDGVVLTSLRKGSKGRLVVLLQTALNTAGYNCGTVDGIFGANTETAVKAYQSKKGLTQTGIVDAVTWKILLQDSE